MIQADDIINHEFLAAQHKSTCIRHGQAGMYHVCCPKSMIHQDILTDSGEIVIRYNSQMIILGCVCIIHHNASPGLARKQLHKITRCNQE